MEESPLLDDYVLSLSRSSRPKVCFVATASGDNENYIVRFYRRFNRAHCTPTHLELSIGSASFRRARMPARIEYASRESKPSSP